MGKTLSRLERVLEKLSEMLLSAAEKAAEDSKPGPQSDWIAKSGGASGSGARGRYYAPPETDND